MTSFNLDDHHRKVIVFFYFVVFNFLRHPSLIFRILCEHFLCSLMWLPMLKTEGIKTNAFPKYQATVNLQIDRSLITTITYVFGVNSSMKQANVEFRTSMDWKAAVSLLKSRRLRWRKRSVMCLTVNLHDNLNCLIISLIFSKRRGSLWGFRVQWDIT